MAIHLKPLKEQRIVITGASSGIGLATARMAAAQGAKVMMAARDGTALQSIKDELTASGAEVDFTLTDVSREGDVAALAEATVARFGGFDTWVNDAGAVIIAKLEDTPTDDHRKLFDTNYFGVVYGSMAAVKYFREAKQAGAIINLGSAESNVSVPFSVAYSATKHAIKGFTDGLRIELERDDLPISVTLIRPSAIDTPIFEHATTYAGGVGKAPGPQYAPAAVADAIVFAAAHPKQDIAVGSTAAISAKLDALVPRFLDRAESHVATEALIDSSRQPEADTLNEVPREGRERSRLNRGRGFSITSKAQQHTGGLAALALIAGLGTVLVAIGQGRRVQAGQ